METNKIHHHIFAWTALVVLFSTFSFCARESFASDITGSMVVKLVNESREAVGISEVIENSILNNVARDKVRDMIKNNYFAHTSPEGKDPWTWFAKNDYKYLAAGENLAINFTSAERQHKAWMASPTHKKNIMNPVYREIGVAVVKGKIDGEETTITVQVFGAPLAMAVNGKENQPAEAVRGAEVFGGEAVLGDTIKNGEAYFSNKNGLFNTNNLMILFALVLLLEIATYFYERSREAKKQKVLLFLKVHV